MVPGGRREGGHVADAPGLAVLPCRELVDDDAQEVLMQRAEARMLWFVTVTKVNQTNQVMAYIVYVCAVFHSLYICVSLAEPNTT